MWSYKLGQTFCLKYSALIMQKAYIDFAKQAQQAGNPRGQKGLDAMNKVIPEGLLAGTGGKGVFYDETEENGPTSYSRPLLPGDQLQGAKPAASAPRSIPKWNAPAATARRPASPLLQRLPGMTYQDNFGALLPSRWKSANAGPVVDVEATACLS